MKKESHYFHCASKGLEDRLLFGSKEQFVAGMNRIGFCLLSFPDLVVIAFVLMDNHIHIILHGTKEDCEGFMAKYKKLTAYYLANKTECRLDEFEYDCWLIPNKEKLTEKICYVLRNPLAAGMGIMPSSYYWGSGPLMFAGKFAEDAYGKCCKIGATTEYYRRKVFGTKQEIPDDWLVNDDGMIWPGSYVNFHNAETAFASIQNYMYELNRKNEDVINQEMYGERISLIDDDVLKILKIASLENFGEPDITLLPAAQRLELIRIIRRSHNVNLKQLSRLLHISPIQLKAIWPQ